MRCHYEQVEVGKPRLIASGGISLLTMPKLAELGCEGTIIGKAIYEEELV
jgi:phosphoribosylformimino-5-aminoimidazole carboxamide ribotide isomerase